MVEYDCEDCSIHVLLAGADEAPDDGLCMVCHFIAGLDESSPGIKEFAEHMRRGQREMVSGKYDDGKRIT